MLIVFKDKCGLELASIFVNTNGFVKRSPLFYEFENPQNSCHNEIKLSGYASTYEAYSDIYNLFDKGCLCLMNSSCHFQFDNLNWNQGGRVTIENLSITFNDKESVSLAGLV